MHTWVKNDSVFLIHFKREKIELIVKWVLALMRNLRMTSIFLTRILQYIYTYIYTHTHVVGAEGKRERERERERERLIDFIAGLPKIVVVIRTVHRHFFQVIHGCMTCIGWWNVHIEVGVTSGQTLKFAHFLFPVLVSMEMCSEWVSLQPGSFSNSAEQNTLKFCVSPMQSDFCINLLRFCWFIKLLKFCCFF